MTTVLYFTDPLGITQGYAPLFNQLVRACGIPPQAIQYANVHSLVPNALGRRANELEKCANPEQYENVKRVVDHTIQSVKPSLIVTSCAATLHVLNEQEWRADKIGVCRGSKYDYQGIPAIVVTPISAMHRKTKSKDIDFDSEGVADTYQIKDGHWLLARDWGKVGRYFNGKQRRFPSFTYSVCRSVEDLDAAVESLTKAVAIACDIETTGSREAGGSCISCAGYTGLMPDGDLRTYVIPFADKFKIGGVFWDCDSEFAHAIRAVQTINANDAIKILQNGSYDSAYFITYGMPLNNYALDTMHLWHSLYPELEKSLDVIASVMLDEYRYWKQDIKGVQEDKSGARRDKSMEKFWRYNGLDCYNTMCSALLLTRLVKHFPDITFNYANEFPQMLAGLVMTMRGLRADFPRREELRGKLEKEAEESLATFRRMVDDPDFNVNSSPQKNELFYDILKATPRNAKGKLIKGGGTKGRSAGKNALKMIKTEHPFFRLIVEAMEATQEPANQISKVCNVHVATERFRSTIGVRTETWRYSSSSSPFWDGTNAQNIRKSMRDWLTADDGYILFDVDYSQSDAVFVAYESNDLRYIDTMSSGRDSHAIHAEFFFKRSYDSIVAGKKADDPAITHPIKGIRNITKRVVHGANFQMAGGTLLVTMGKESVVAAAEYMGYADAATWTESQMESFCQRMLNSFRHLYPRLSKNGWYGEIAKLLVRDRKITNAFGMTRSFLGNPKDFGTQREATAFYGQSDTAGNMNRCMEELLYGYIPPVFRDGPNEHAKEKPLQLDGKEFGMEFCLQVHDSLIGQINTRAPRWKEAMHNLLTVMERPITINGHRVVVPAEAEIGKRWGKSMIPWRSGDPYDLDRVMM